MWGQLLWLPGCASCSGMLPWLCTRCSPPRSYARGAPACTSPCVAVRLRMCALCARTKLWIQGCASSSAMVARRAGSRTSARAMKSRAPGDRPGGYATSCVLILSSVSGGVFCAAGGGWGGG
jgi:hypothetical protein